DPITGAYPPERPQPLPPLDIPLPPIPRLQLLGALRPRHRHRLAHRLPPAMATASSPPASRSNGISTYLTQRAVSSALSGVPRSQAADGGPLARRPTWRGLLLRYEQKAGNRLGLLRRACCPVRSHCYLRLTG